MGWRQARHAFTVKGLGALPIAHIEVHATGTFLGAMALGGGQLGVLMLMDRPPNDDRVIVPRPEFLPPGFPWGGAPITCSFEQIV